VKIGYLSTFYPFRGGIAQFNAALLKELRLENQVLAFNFKRQYPEFLFPGSTQYVTENDKAEPVESIRKLDTINPITYYTTYKAIRKFNPDLMISKFWMPFFGPSLGYVLKSLKKKGVKNIGILDNVIPHERRPGDIQFTKYYINSNSAFIVMSNTVRDDLLKFKPDAIYKQVLHPLYDHFGSLIQKNEAREKLGIQHNKNVLLFFGFIRKYKGLDLLLESIRFLPDDYLLVIAGENYGSFDEYEQIIKNYNLENKVKLFIRYIDDGEVPQFFSASDVCILPYKLATQSGILGISYHFGLPVIATDTGGLREMIEPFNTGIIVREPAPNLLSSAIVDFFNLELSSQFKANIEKYKQKASWASLAKEILDLYEILKNNQNL
jgi:glycosyltransferase involved in cell wall biosynthesis